MVQNKIKNVQLTFFPSYEYDEIEHDFDTPCVSDNEYIKINNFMIKNRASLIEKTLTFRNSKSKEEFVDFIYKFINFLHDEGICGQGNMGYIVPDKIGIRFRKPKVVWATTMRFSDWMKKNNLQEIELDFD